MIDLKQLEFWQFEDMSHHRLYEMFQLHIEDGLHVPENHAKQIRFLKRDSARWLWSEHLQDSLPHHGSEPLYHLAYGTSINLLNVQWSEELVEETRHTIHNFGIPYDQHVYAIMSPHDIVQTRWKMVVRYWEVFMDAVGMNTIITDGSHQWACVFDHSQFIRMSSHVKMGNLE